LLTWNAVIGSDPEQRETQPRIGTVREVGPIWGGLAALEFRASPGRADWVVAPVIPPDIQLTGLPTLGEIEETVQKFGKLIFDAVAQSYSAPRFAFGVVALHSQPSKEASYVELTDLLRIASLQLEGASDFSYQINRMRPSKAVSGLSINRLSRWASVAFQGLRMQLSMFPTGSADGTVTSRQSPPVHATRAEFDINTAADRREPIPTSARKSLLDELAELSLELLEKGDVP
jgi:hypothetical protein